MKPRPLILRAQAEQDIEQAVSYYLAEGAEQAALAFVDALENTFKHIARRPAVGSPRYAVELDLPGLRTWQVSRFPYLVFYRELDSQLDVWRVLHAQRDIPALMTTTEHG